MYGTGLCAVCASRCSTFSTRISRTIRYGFAAMSGRKPSPNGKGWKRAVSSPCNTRKRRSPCGAVPLHPFLVVENYDHLSGPATTGAPAAAICAKVARRSASGSFAADDPETGRPIPEPAEFYIDIDICMNCGFCAEFCPFDAIKMDHDYELASYDRTTAHNLRQGAALEGVPLLAEYRPDPRRRGSRSARRLGAQGRAQAENSATRRRRARPPNKRASPTHDAQGQPDTLPF